MRLRRAASVRAGGESPRPKRRRHGRRRPAAKVVPAATPRRPSRQRSKPRLRLPWPNSRRTALVGATCVAAGVAAWWLGGEVVERLVAHPAMAIREVRVEGAVQADVAQIRALADVVEGDPWLAVDPDRIKFRLEAHPWVRRARVQRPWPGQVRVRIEECVPVARIRVDQRSYGLCGDLRVVPLPDETDGLPEIRDFGSGSGADEEWLARGLAYLEALRDTGVVEPVRLDLRRDGADWIVLPDRGFEAEVDGRIPAPRAARNVSAFLERLDGEGGSRGTLRLIAEGTAVWKGAA